MVLKEIETSEGIASAGSPGKMSRLELIVFSFYLSIIKKHIDQWRNENTSPLENIPMLVSGNGFIVDWNNRTGVCSNAYTGRWLWLVGNKNRIFSNIPFSTFPYFRCQYRGGCYAG
jgi:hypothetical protein